MVESEDKQKATATIEKKIAALPPNSKRRALQEGRKDRIAESTPLLEPDGLGERALKKVEEQRAAKKASTKQLMDRRAKKGKK